MIKILYFDTNAVVKFFLKEKGSNIIKWIVDNQVTHSISISTGEQTVKEFPTVIEKIMRKGTICQQKAQIIIDQAMGTYFSQVFHIRDDKPRPGFNGGKDAEYEDLINKYGLKMGVNDWDARHLMCVINYLRCFGGGSAPKVVTSDKGFKKIIKGEGYQVIDPEKVTIRELKSLLKG